MNLNIDMSEVTRLTRMGRLDEAMTVLRAGVLPASPETTKDVVAEVIEMVQTDGTGSAWCAASGGAETVPPAAKPRTAKVKLDGLAELVGLHTAFAARGTVADSQARPLAPGATFDNRVFANAAGSRTYRLYVPGSYTGQPVPLMVMLHGCTQSPEDFAAGTRMNALAEAHGFLVAYPAQSQAANMNRCWNWFNSADQQREGGEPSLLAGITREVMADYAVDARRVFVAGLSAGGAMAAILGHAYPDLYAGIGVHSGLPVGAAHDMASAFAAMTQGNPSAAVGGKRATVPMIIFHGDADRTVHVSNGDQLTTQAHRSGGLKRHAPFQDSHGGRQHTTTRYSDGQGRIVLEHWLLHGAGHAWSGGDSSGSFTDGKGPVASAEMVRFFLKLRA